MKRLTVLAFLAVAACGADGEPIQPSANINLGVGASGVTTGVGIGLSKGPISIAIGL